LNTNSKETALFRQSNFKRVLYNLDRVYLNTYDDDDKYKINNEEGNEEHKWPEKEIEKGYCTLQTTNKDKKGDYAYIEARDFRK